MVDVVIFFCGRLMKLLDKLNGTLGEAFYHLRRYFLKFKDGSMNIRTKMVFFCNIAKLQ